MAVMRIHRAVAKVGDLDLFYRDTRAEGPAILCLHGRWGRGETWADFWARYGSRYRVIAPDQRGHGLSSRPRGSYSTREMAGDMIGLLDGLGIGTFVVVGHSMGGGIAGYMAATWPERVLGAAILDKSASGPEPEASGPEAPGASEQAWDAAGDPVSRDWPLPFASLAEARERVRADMGSELAVEYFMQSMAETAEGYRPLFSAEAMAANIASYRGWYGLLPRIACPVLLVRASGGEAVPDADFAKMRELIPDCLAFTARNADHNVHQSDPEEFHSYFDRFLDKVFRA